MNNKGFTLIELLAVLVILTAIMGIAIPSITSSMERTKAKQDKAKYKVLESTAEVYVADHKSLVYQKMEDAHTDYINICLGDMANYLADDALKLSNGNVILGYVKFTKPSTYEFIPTNTAYTNCIN